tara:strand:+ start:7688 stop:9565 length:1878 start_codon:yes stop_codon:yes gene_type:complete
MPVYISKKSPIEEGLTALTRVAEGVGNAEVEKRRRFETDRDYNFKREQFDESIRQYDETFDFNEDKFATDFNETKRVNDRTFSESQRQFDTGLVHDKGMQTERIESQEEIQRQARQVDRERIAAQRYQTNLTYKNQQEQRSASLKSNKTWIDQLEILGKEDERLYQQTYTVVDGSGNERRVVWKDTIETMRKAVNSGYAQEMQAVEGAPEGHYRYAPHQMDEQLDSLGINPAKIIQGDNPQALRYNQTLKNIVAEWDKGNQAKAIQMAGEFQGGGVGFFGSRAERGATSAKGGEGVETSGAYSPLTGDSVNEELKQRYELYAGTQYPGGISAWRSLSVEEQRAHVEDLDAKRQNLDVYRRQARQEEKQMNEDELVFKLEQEALYASGDMEGYDFKEAHFAGSPFYKGQSGDPQIALGNIADPKDRRSTQREYDEIIRLTAKAQNLWFFEGTDWNPSESADENATRVAAIEDVVLQIAQAGESIDQTLGGSHGSNVAGYFVDRLYNGAEADSYRIIYNESTSTTGNSGVNLEAAREQYTGAGLVVPEIARLVDNMEQDPAETDPANLSPSDQIQLWNALKTPAGYKFLTSSPYMKNRGQALTRDQAFQYMESFPEGYDMNQVNWVE